MAHFKRWLWPAADGQLVLTARTHRGPSIATLLKDIILPILASFQVQTTGERHLRPLRSAQPLSCSRGLPTHFSWHRRPWDCARQGQAKSNAHSGADTANQVLQEQLLWVMSKLASTRSRCALAVRTHHAFLRKSKQSDSSFRVLANCLY
jgi:hypothetical protein